MKRAAIACAVWLLSACADAPSGSYAFVGPFLNDSIARRVLTANIAQEVRLRRFLPIGEVFLSDSSVTVQEQGKAPIWSDSIMHRWEAAGYVERYNQRPLGSGISARDKKALRALGVVSLTTIKPTEKGKQYGCDEDRRAQFGGACLEVTPGRITAVDIVHNELGKKHLYYYRFILANIRYEPSEELHALYGLDPWHHKYAAVLGFNPFTKGWWVELEAEENLRIGGIDTRKLEAFWATRDSLPSILAAIRGL